MRPDVDALLECVIAVPGSNDICMYISTEAARILRSQSLVTSYPTRIKRHTRTTDGRECTEPDTKVFFSFRYISTFICYLFSTTSFHKYPQTSFKHIYLGHFEMFYQFASFSSDFQTLHLIVAAHLFFFLKITP